jgi:phospholipid/cholesterol/gamma-HCH transport system permease protein
MSDEAALRLAPEGQVLRLTATGGWVADEASHLESLIATIDGEARGATRLELDLAGVSQLDTLGAKLLDDVRNRFVAAGLRVDLRNASEPQRVLIEEVATRRQAAPTPPAAGNAFVDLLAEIGEKMVLMGRDIAGITVFLGELITMIGRIFVGKARFRPAAVVTQIERMGLRGVPIIVLISFLVGAIVAQQTIFQLEQFGATIYVVDLLGILMLREVGLLLASIMVAGRSGSAITAELGSMKMREEIDAMRVMGLDPMEVLILPRVLALMISLPLLTFLASVSGIFGGGLVAWLYGGITPVTILDRLRDAIWISTFLVGIIKAPAMALMIGTTACIEGMKVRGSAESLGRQTTSSVVKSIFSVIVVDGLFAMFFAAIRY